MSKRKTIYELLPSPKKYSVRNFIRLWNGSSGACAQLTPKEVFTKIFYRNAFLVDRVINVIGLIKKILKIDSPQYNLENLPFDTSSFIFKGLIGLRLEKDVYLFESVNNIDRSFVLKVVDRLSNEDERKVFQWKIIIEQTYSRMKVIYNEIPSFILDYEIVIIKNPSYPQEYCVAIKQAFQYGELLDIFMDIKEEKLLELINMHENLANSFKLFIQKTLEHFEKTGEIIDIGSKGNAVIRIKPGGEPSLIFIDDGLQYLGNKRDSKNLPSLKKLNRLAELRKIIG